MSHRHWSTAVWPGVSSVASRSPITPYIVLITGDQHKIGPEALDSVIQRDNRLYTDTRVRSWMTARRSSAVTVPVWLKWLVSFC